MYRSLDPCMDLACIVCDVKIITLLQDQRL